MTGAFLIGAVSLALLMLPECGEVSATLSGEAALAYAGLLAACTTSALSLFLLRQAG